MVVAVVVVAMAAMGDREMQAEAAVADYFSLEEMEPIQHTQVVVVVVQMPTPVRMRVVFRQLEEMEELI